MKSLIPHPFLTRLTVSPTGELLDNRGRTATITTGKHWYLLSDDGTETSPKFGRALRQKATIRPDVGIFYMDHKIHGGTIPDLRPDFDLTLLLAYDYIGLPIAIRADALAKLHAGARAHGAAFSYMLLLQAVQHGIGIARIAQLLATRARRYPQIPRADRWRVVNLWLGASRAHFDLHPGIPPYAIQLRRSATDCPPVTLCIPTRQRSGVANVDGPHGLPLINGLLETITRLDYPMDRLHVIVGDDRSDGVAYADRTWPFELTRIHTASPTRKWFNHGSMMNQLWRLSQTEQIVLIDDDITSTSADWLRALLTFSMQENVGGVGARLLSPGGSIQHAGIAGGLLDLFAPAWLARPADEPTYQDWAIVHREWSMVSGAVFATRRTILEEINGLDEMFGADFIDVDMCLRLRSLGYRVVYTPHAEFARQDRARHSRATVSGSEQARFLKRWGAYLANDPMFHPLLDRHSLALRPCGTAEGDENRVR